MEGLYLKKAWARPQARAAWVSTVRRYLCRGHRRDDPAARRPKQGSLHKRSVADKCDDKTRSQKTRGIIHSSIISFVHPFIHPLIASHTYKKNTPSKRRADTKTKENENNRKACVLRTYLQSSTCPPPPWPTRRRPPCAHRGSRASPAVRGGGAAGWEACPLWGGLRVANGIAEE